jgi:hypothetical protein
LYFTTRKIPFADKDIERDADAARELAARPRRWGSDGPRPGDRRARAPLLGFDRARIETLLGEPT